MSTTTRPTAGPAREWHFPRFERRTLSNGVRVVVAPVHTLPLATVLAVVDAAGADADTRGHEGLAQLTARAMTEGTTTHDGAALALAWEHLGTSVDTSADWDGAYASFTALRERLPAALSLFADVVMRPSFPAHEVKRLRDERMAGILQLESDPGGLADERFAQVIYREGSRLGRSDGGTRASVAALDAATCAAFHAAHWVPASTTLIVTGDVTVDDAVTLLEGAFGGWMGEAPASTSIDDAAVNAGRTVHLVDKPGAPQSELRVGHVAVPRRHPDFFALTLGNAILGGLFNSRINLNLRERHGYTYGASSGFDWRRTAGPFVVSSAVSTDVTQPALAEVLHELTQIRDALVTDDELTHAQRYLAGVFPIRYETTGAIASALSALVSYGLPEDYFDTYRDRVRAVTAEAIREAARRHLHLDTLQVVIVGDAAVLQPVLAAWDFGPIVVHRADDE
jgi:zinc protease